MEPAASTGGEGVQRASKRLSEFVTAELVAALSEAAHNDDAWKEAIRGPDTFLQGRGIDTPDDVEVRLYEVAIPSTQGATRLAEHYCEPPLVLQFFTAAIQECARKAVVVSGREYDPGLGGFTPVATVEVCLVSFVRYETRWYCGLPALKRAG